MSRDRGKELGAVAAGQVGAADATGEDDVADKRPGRTQQDEVPRTVAGRGGPAERQARPRGPGAPAAPPRAGGGAAGRGALPRGGSGAPRRGGGGGTERDIGRDRGQHRLEAAAGLLFGE